MTKLEEMLLNAKSEIEACTSHTELNDKKAFYLGKKSPLNELMKSMATLSVEEKKTLGNSAYLMLAKDILHKQFRIP